MPSKPLSDLSKEAVAVWLLACVAMPYVVAATDRSSRVAPVVAAGVLGLLGVGVAVAYWGRVRVAWHLIQACMVAAVCLGGAFGNRWLFVGAAALMICFCFSLYAPEVREEFGIHAAPREAGVFLVLLAMAAFLALVNPRFLKGGNPMTLARQFSMVGIMAVGMTMVIVVGGIDLSVGAVIALSGCLATQAMRHWDCSLWVAVLISVGVGAAVGCVNGALIGCFRMPPFVVTLGTMGMAQSLALVVTEAQQVPVKGCVAEQGFYRVAEGHFLGAPNPVWLMALAVALGHLFLCFTRTGRHIYYIGANEEAARLSGLRVTAIKWGVYAVCGLLAGLAGIIMASRGRSGQPTEGPGTELQVIAAVIIGGASFSGGVGTVLGSFLGTATLGVLTQGLILLGIGTNWQGFVGGAVIIGAVALGLLRKRG